MLKRVYNQGVILQSSGECSPNRPSNAHISNAGMAIFTIGRPLVRPLSTCSSSLTRGFRSLSRSQSLDCEKQFILL
jgi:hypothetical protein